MGRKGKRSSRMWDLCRCRRRAKRWQADRSQNSEFRTQNREHMSRAAGGFIWGLSSIKRGVARVLDRSEPVIEWIIRLCGWSAIIFVVAIFLFVFKEGAPALTQIDLKEFLTSANWRPTSVVREQYGILALMVGTLSVTVLAMLIAVPFGLLAAIPSVVWGFIGYMVIGPVIIKVTGAPVGVNVLNGGIILALMSVPVIVSVSEDALRAVPDSFREAAQALGAHRWETVRRVLFPAARNGLLAACLLGMGRAIGETMAVLLATGHNLRIPHALTDPVRTITATIAAEMGETVNGGPHYRMLFVLGIVLFIITCGINVASDLIVKGVKKANQA